jgi:hypothetical protein
MKLIDDLKLQLDSIDDGHVKNIISKIKEFICEYESNIENDECTCDEEDIDELNQSIEIKSLTHHPNIEFIDSSKIITEDNSITNIWYVDNFESISGACSTGKIIYKDSELYMNICEQNGKTTVNLLVTINNELKNITFILEKTCNSANNYDMIFYL